MQNTERWEYLFVVCRNAGGDWRPCWINEPKLGNWEEGPTIYVVANQLGVYGWEAVSSTPSGKEQDSLRILFKRPLRRLDTWSSDARAESKADTSTCPACHTAIQSESRFCPNCLEILVGAPAVVSEPKPAQSVHIPQLEYAGESLQKSGFGGGSFRGCTLLIALGDSDNIETSADGTLLVRISGVLERRVDVRNADFKRVTLRTQAIGQTTQLCYRYTVEEPLFNTSKDYNVEVEFTTSEGKKFKAQRKL